MGSMSTDLSNRKGSIDTHVDARTPMEGPWSQFSRGIWDANGCMRNAHGFEGSKFGVSNPLSRSSATSLVEQRFKPSQCQESPRLWFVHLNCW